MKHSPLLISAEAGRTAARKTPSTTQTPSSKPYFVGGLQIIIERTFGETRRRVKVIGLLPGEHCCLKLVWAVVLDRASAGWRGFAMTPAGLRLLADLRRSLHDPPSTAATEFGVHTETGVAPTDSVAIA